MVKKSQILGQKKSQMLGQNVSLMYSPKSESIIFEKRNCLKSKSLEDLFGSQNLQPLFRFIVKSINSAIEDDKRNNFRNYLKANQSELFLTKKQSEIIEMVNVAIVLYPDQILRMCKTDGIVMYKVKRVLTSDLDSVLNYRISTNQY